MKKIDFNKLIRDIINAAKGEATIKGDKANLIPEQDLKTFAENNELITTLKLEVTITNDSGQLYGGIKKRARKSVLLTMNDAE